jgi:hypothetical protein
MGGSPITQIAHLFASIMLSLAFASFADSLAFDLGLTPQALCLRLLRRLSGPFTGIRIAHSICCFKKIRTMVGVVHRKRTFLEDTVCVRNRS